MAGDRDDASLGEGSLEAAADGRNLVFPHRVFQRRHLGLREDTVALVIAGDPVKPQNAALRRWGTAADSGVTGRCFRLEDPVERIAEAGTPGDQLIEVLEMRGGEVIGAAAVEYHEDQVSRAGYRRWCRGAALGPIADGQRRRGDEHNRECEGRRTTQRTQPVWRHPDTHGLL